MKINPKLTRNCFLAATLFLLVFALIYEHFSHEVYSPFMLGAFIIPLLGGVLPYAIFCRLPERFAPSVIAGYLYNSGIASLSCGSVFLGVLEIYGTTNRLGLVYWIVGFSLVVAGLICYTFSYERGSRDSTKPGSAF